MAEGIIRRHSQSCPARAGGGCRCRAGYEASVYSPKDRRKIRKTFKRETEARSWRAEAKRALDRGMLRAPSRRTLSEAASAWLAGAERGEIRNRSGHVYKPATLRGYRHALVERVLPALGSRRLGSLTTGDFQKLVDGWHVEGHAASTIRNSIKPLQAIYRRARAREGIALNPTHDLELPAADTTEVEIIAPTVAARILAASSAEDRAIWATALYAGLRYGELRALRWGAVDLRGGIIRVLESWDPKEGPIAPKSRKSKRKVPVPSMLRDCLRDHGLRVGDTAAESLLFTDGKGGPFHAATIYRRADCAWEADAARRACRERFGAAAPADDEEAERIAIALWQDGHPEQAIAAALGLSIARVGEFIGELPQPAESRHARKPERLRLHQARHTYASFMIAAGVNAKALSTFMGHSSIKVTFDLYGHLMPGSEAEAASLLDAYLDADDESEEEGGGEVATDGSA